MQYGVQYTLNLSGINTKVEQMRIRILEGLITDKSGNGNKQTDLMLFSTLKATNTENDSYHGFLGNSNIERQNIDNVTFVNNIPSTVYDFAEGVYKDATAWDVSVQQDNSIIAWYETNENESIKVYIGALGDIFANTDSS